MGIERVHEKARHEAEAAGVRGCRERTEIVARDGRREPQKPRLEDRRRVAFPAHVAVPLSQDVERQLVGPAFWPGVAHQQRQQRHGMQRDRVGLDPREIFGRQMRSATQQVSNPRRSIRLGPVHTERVRIVGAAGLLLAVTMKCSGGSNVCGSLSNGIQPVHSIVSAPAVGRQRPVAARTHRDAAGGVVADVAIDVAIHEVLRRHDEITERRREIVPVARLGSRAGMPAAWCRRRRAQSIGAGAAPGAPAGDLGGSSGVAALIASETSGPMTRHAHGELNRRRP